MSDYCIICECEPDAPFGWFTEVDGSEAVCPWCVKDLRRIRELVKTHDGSDYHARQLFDQIDCLIEETKGVTSND
jgi:hypothetical protein